MGVDGEAFMMESKVAAVESLHIFPSWVGVVGGVIYVKARQSQISIRENKMESYPPLS